MMRRRELGGITLGSKRNEGTAASTRVMTAMQGVMERRENMKYDAWVGKGIERKELAKCRGRWNNLGHV